MNKQLFKSKMKHKAAPKAAICDHRIMEVKMIDGKQMCVCVKCGYKLLKTRVKE